jgi:hypothetical protein
VVGRFATEDSLRSVLRKIPNGQKIADPLSLNLYAYCFDNPLYYVDISGHDPAPVWAKNINSGKGTDEDYKKAFEVYENGLASVWAGSARKIVDKAIEKTLNILYVNGLPKTGEPNSVGRLYNPDGSVKQERYYGPDGQPVRDRDYNHSGEGHEFPHDHDWVGGERQKGIPVPHTQGDDNTAEIVAGGVAAVGTGYVIYRIVRMMISLAPPLWPTIPANALIP